MKKILLFIFVLASSALFAQTSEVSVKSKTYKPEGKQVLVYTTADNTDYRISPTVKIGRAHV